MARSIRATTLLLIALGAAAPALPASAAAANAGGAAPGSEVDSTTPTSEGSVGGAAPGATPAQRATSAGVGGALAGHKPPRPKAVRRKPAARRPAARAPASPAPVAPAPSVSTRSGVFPVQGSFSFGGDGARFGAGRPGHSHQGQDIAAAEGTPVVTPRAGTVHWIAYQAQGAGYYVVITGDDGRHYVFMHLQKDSTVVTKGQPVIAGQRIASVGSTGGSDGPHLHFEIWLNGWRASKASMPIDPLPELQAWSAST